VFKTIKADQPTEEEELPDYQAHRFYPVQLGEVFQTPSLVWLIIDFVPSPRSQVGVLGIVMALG
jgi:hypothetical protein